MAPTKNKSANNRLPLSTLWIVLYTSLPGFMPSSSSSSVMLLLFVVSSLLDITLFLVGISFRFTSLDPVLIFSFKSLICSLLLLKILLFKSSFSYFLTIVSDGSISLVIVC
uniref:Uncharacterized protein n=1 Tax=Cacopsylla melanoneura TaxID=428564 RepID=A0A8D8ZS19_9HEMI